MGQFGKSCRRKLSLKREKIEADPAKITPRPVAKGKPERSK
jgi:hypothetical protein